MIWSWLQAPHSSKRQSLSISKTQIQRVKSRGYSQERKDEKKSIDTGDSWEIILPHFKNISVLLLVVTFHHVSLPEFVMHLGYLRISEYSP